MSGIASTGLRRTRHIIRILRRGCTNRPFYVLVVQPKHKDVFDEAAIIEQVGTYDGMPNAAGEKLCALNFDRIRYWLGSGALTSKPVDHLLGLSGFFPVHPMSYIGARRNRTDLANKAMELEEAQKSAKESTSG